MNGKGSKSRPFSVSRDTFEANWDLIFRKNKQTIQESNESELRKHSLTRRRGAAKGN